MIDEQILKSEEKAVFSLRKLYRKFGYLPYKMSKFEEYDLYVRNKDFLLSDRVITFNDTNGKLMALKPDVTLSIIKNCEDIPGVKQKVYYNENVYRVSERTHRYKEIMQTGLECIGDVDLYDVFEAVTLAAGSLALISDSFVLEISQLDLLSETLDKISTSRTFKEQAIRFISSKNEHDLKRTCAEYGISVEDAEKLSVFISAYGERKKVIEALRAIYDEKSLKDIVALSEMLDTTMYGDKIMFDFSVVNDMNYYNGFVFKGFLNGISGGVLAGGQYDNLMRKMGKKSGAVGFALYLDLLEQLAKDKSDYDVDVVVLYDETTDMAVVANTVNAIVASGRTVSAQKAVSQKLRCKEYKDVRKEKSGC